LTCCAKQSNGSQSFMYAVERAGCPPDVKIGAKNF
jgi:hypothetical protein